MQYRYTKGWRKDKAKGVCNGNCPRCRGWIGSLKKEPGFKRKDYREFKQDLITTLEDYWIWKDFTEKEFDDIIELYSYGKENDDKHDKREKRNL